ncbi:MAG: HD domain-containing phosphohydrolase [Nitrospirales bacterium]
MNAPKPPASRALFLEFAEVLIVDDEEAIRHILATLLEPQGYHCTLANNAREARKLLENREFHLVLCDVNMPGESGIDLVRHILVDRPDTAVVMVTGIDSPGLASEALKAGAYGYVIKPFQGTEILINVANALRRRRLEIDNRAHRDNLEQIVRARTAALRQSLDWLERSQKELRLSQEETIQRLAIAAEFRDKSTAQHIQRMSRYCALLAQRYGLKEDHCELIRTASPMHDIGKIGTPDYVLLKPGKFTSEEFDVIAQHADIGYRILSGSDAELLKMAAMIAWTHHERYDGSGYPRGLAGMDIPLEGRIAAIADAFDALTTKRVYKPAFPMDEAMSVMKNHRESHFDPELLDLFLDSTEGLLAIRDQHQDDYASGS